MDSAAKTPTMAEVAAKAGVSKMAVSLALRGSPRVSEAKRKMILEVAAAMNYRPNPQVQTLMANLRATRPVEMHSVIAWITTFGTEFGWEKHRVSVDYFKGALLRGKELGYRVEPMWAFSKGMRGSRLSDVLAARGINGVIIPPTPNTETQLDLRWEELASATIGYSFTQPKLHRAAANLPDAMSVALHKCEQLGYERIGFVITSDTDFRVNHSWMAVYLAWQHFQKPSRVLPIHYVAENTPIEKHLGAWVKKHKPDVIISPYREIKLWLPEMLGINIPEDVGYVSLANRADQYLDMLGVKVSGIDQQDDAIGAAAVDLVVAQLQRNEKGLPVTPKVVLTEGLWRDGETVGKKIKPAKQQPAKKVKGRAVRKKPLATKSS